MKFTPNLYLDKNSVSLIISFFSLIVSLIALAWNIYRDIILKPRLKVQISVSHLIGEAIQRETHVVVRATNLGPGTIYCTLVVIKNESLWRRLIRRMEWAVIIPNYKHPMNSRLPAKIDVGDTISLLFTYNKECFLSQKFNHVGINDSFGRTHWAMRSDFKQAVKIFKKDFKNGDKQ